MIDQVWSALHGAPGAPAGITVRRPGAILPSPLPVGDWAVATVASALLAAADLAEVRGAGRPAVTLDADHVAAAFTSERHLRLDGQPVGPGFAPLSTWLRTADGWMRSHANYPHHRAALLTALGLAEAIHGGADTEAGTDTEVEIDAVRAAAARRTGESLEDAVFAAGGCAAVVRDRATWTAHPQGQALAGLGLLDLDEGPAPGPAPAPPPRPLAFGELPAAGIRVIDLSRVIAGPVAGRTLAAFGADVLRIDAPDAVELPGAVLDGGPGKRWARLDLRTREGAAAFDALLADADVLIGGYRPGALERLGFGPRDVAARHPHLVTASLSAWGTVGPWGERRGFDSLVQAASGIAAVCTEPGDETPGALPAQALDHGTGHVIAAAVLRGLAHRARTGRPLHARFALARTAGWLLAQPHADAHAHADVHAARAAPADGRPATPDPSPLLIDLPSGSSTVTVVAPPGELDGTPLRWSEAIVPIDRASWR